LAVGLLCLRELAAQPLPILAEAVENDLQRAALSLRPDLEQTLAELLESGALDVIAKPFDPMTLPATVRSIWRRLQS
jgi:DNA-binding response OmpR family regulator